jgi:hypothetical protein
MPYALKASVKTLNALRFTRRASKRIQYESKLALHKHGRYLVKMLRDTRFQPYPGYDSEDKSRDFLYYRERKLMKSIRSKGIDGRIGVEISAGQGTGDDRARWQERGGIKSGNPFVNIPLQGVLTRTGRTKAAFSTPEAGFGTKGYFRVPIESGGFVYFLRRNKNTLIPMWLQKSSVLIPPRFKFAETIQSKQAADLRRQQIVLAVRRAVRESKSK